MTTLEGRTVVLVGGGSGIGLAVARQAVAAGARVHLGGRTESRLRAAQAQLGPSATWQVVDSTDHGSLAAFFGALERIDHLFTPGASYTVGPMRELTNEQAASPFVTKFWGQYHAVRHATARFSPDASVVLMSGPPRSFQRKINDLPRRPRPEGCLQRLEWAGLACRSLRAGG